MSEGPHDQKPNRVQKLEPGGQNQLPWDWVERAVEITPGVNTLAAHNVVVARKP